MKSLLHVKFHFDTSTRSKHIFLTLMWCILLFAVLGNHDYRGDALAQLSPILKQKDNRWICMRSYIVDTGNVIKLILIMKF